MVRHPIFCRLEFTLICTILYTFLCPAVGGMNWPTASEAVWGIWKSYSLAIRAMEGLSCLE